MIFLKTRRDLNEWASQSQESMRRERRASWCCGNRKIENETVRCRLREIKGTYSRSEDRFLTIGGVTAPLCPCVAFRQFTKEKVCYLTLDNLYFLFFILTKYSITFVMLGAEREGESYPKRAYEEKLMVVDY